MASSAPSGIPISATITSPHSIRPGISTCARFLRKKVTVALARTTTSSKPRPRSPCNPLGTSMAITGKSDLFSRRTISAAAPSRGRDSPAPNSASTTTVASLRTSGVSGTTAPSQRLAISAASPFSVSRAPSSGPRQPGAEQRIDHDRRVLENIRRQRHDRAVPAVGHFRCVAFQRFAGPEQRHRNIPAEGGQKTRGDETVAAVVAGATQNDGLAAHKPLHHLIGHRATGILHQSQRRHAMRRGEGIRLVALCDGEDFVLLHLNKTIIARPSSTSLIRPAFRRPIALGGILRTHQADGNAIRIFDDGIARTPERIPRLL